MGPCISRLSGSEPDPPPQTGVPLLPPRIPTPHFAPQNCKGQVVHESTSNSRNSQPSGAASSRHTSRAVSTPPSRTGTPDTFSRQLHPALRRIQSSESLGGPRVFLPRRPSWETMSLNDSIQNVQYDLPSWGRHNSRTPTSSASSSSCSCPCHHPPESSCPCERSSDKCCCGHRPDSPRPCNHTRTLPCLNDRSPAFSKSDTVIHHPQTKGQVQSSSNRSSDTAYSSDSRVKRDPKSRSSSELRSKSRSKSKSKEKSTSESRSVSKENSKSESRSTSKEKSASESRSEPEQPPRVVLSNGMRNATIPPNDDVPTLVESESDVNEGDGPPTLPWDDTWSSNGRMEDVLARVRSSEVTGPSRPATQPDSQHPTAISLEPPPLPPGMNLDQALRAQGWLLPTPSSDAEESCLEKSNFSWMKSYYKGKGKERDDGDDEPPAA